MNHSPKSSYHKLNDRIHLLKEAQAQCEMNILKLSTEVYHDFAHPVETIKRTIRDLANDSDFRSDLVRAGVNTVSHYLTRKLEKSAITAMALKLLDKLSNKAKDTKFEGVVQLISGLISGKKE